MFVVRQEQIDTLGEQRRQRYEDRLVVYLQQLFPDICAPMDAMVLREEIRYGIAAAAKYDITTERDVARYMETMFRLGRDFDTHPATTWVQPILHDPHSTAANRLRRVALAAQRQRAPQQRPRL